MDDLPSDSEDIEMEESDSRDRLSELPDSLILVILSLLPMRDVVRTTIVSKRWKDLWTIVPCLSFSDGDDDANYFYSFRYFVNQVLLRWKGSKVLTFKVKFASYGCSYCPYHDVDPWMDFAMENEVEELDLSLMHIESVSLGKNDPGYCVPECVYLCSSIKKLSLLGCNLKIGLEDVRWNQLRSLRIDGVPVSEGAINRVLSGAPRLEVLILRIMENFQNLNIQSNSLKKLNIEKCLFFPDEPAMDTMLRVWAPNLEILELGGIPYIKCLLINVSSLTDATLGFYAIIHSDDSDFTWNLLLRKTLAHIFPAIHHVEKLTLSYWCIEVIGVMNKKYLLPPSYEVQFLRVNLEYLAVEEIMILLEIFPKLKMVAIESTDHYFREVNYQTFRETLADEEGYYLELEKSTHKSFLLMLRTIEITWPLLEGSIYPFIEFMLKHADALEKIVIRPESRNGSVAPEFFFLAAARKLMAFQKSFPTVELILCDTDK